MLYRLQIMLAAMGPPGGGRNEISQRCLRHFNAVTIDKFDDNTMTRIFTAISDWHFSHGYDAAFSRIGKVRILFVNLATCLIDRISEIFNFS